MVASVNTNAGAFVPDGLLVEGQTFARQITLAAGQSQKRGALLGMITASKKYVLSVAAATDGSQVPSVILAEDCDATSGDRSTVAYFGAKVDERAVIYGTGHTSASAREALRDVGIELHSSVAR